MRRFGSAVLILAILASLLIHFVLLRFIVFDTSPETESEVSYEVTLKYYKPPADKTRQPKKRILKKKEESPPLPPKDVELPVEQPVPDVLEVFRDEDFVETEAEEVRNTEAMQPAQQEQPDETDSLYAESISDLRKRILEQKIYPQAARRRNIEGVVLIFLELDRTGELIELRVIRSSGSKILDNAALSLIKKVVPYKHGLEGALSVEIPIRYSLIE
jgi:protein TonB